MFKKLRPSDPQTRLIRIGLHYVNPAYDGELRKFSHKWVNRLSSRQKDFLGFVGFMAGLFSLAPSLASILMMVTYVSHGPEIAGSFNDILTLFLVSSGIFLTILAAFRPTYAFRGTLLRKKLGLRPDEFFLDNITTMNELHEDWRRTRSRYRYLTSESQDALSDVFVRLCLAYKTFNIPTHREEARAAYHESAEIINDLYSYERSDIDAKEKAVCEAVQARDLAAIETQFLAGEEAQVGKAEATYVETLKTLTAE